MASCDAERREEELLVLESIYGLDLQQHTSGGLPVLGVTLLSNERDGREVVITAHLPSAYPSSEAPVFEVSGVRGEARTVLADVLSKTAAQELGEPCVYSCVEAARELLPSLNLDGEISGHCAESAPSAITRDSSSSTCTTSESTASADSTSTMEESAQITIVKGDPITDRKSTFVGHAARVTSEAEVAQMLTTLKLNSKIARATHNMYAFRVCDRGTNIHDSCDDGEMAAGPRLSALLEAMRIDNVIVVVSRWFGGTLIGPDRFKHINNAARSALERLPAARPPPALKEHGRKVQVEERAAAVPRNVAPAAPSGKKKHGKQARIGKAAKSSS